MGGSVPLFLLPWLQKMSVSMLPTKPISAMRGRGMQSRTGGRTHQRLCPASRSRRAVRDKVGMMMSAPHPAATMVQMRTGRCFAGNSAANGCQMSARVSTNSPEAIPYAAAGSCAMAKSKSRTRGSLMISLNKDKNRNHAGSSSAMSTNCVMTTNCQKSCRDAHPEKSAKCRNACAITLISSRCGGGVVPEFADWHVLEPAHSALPAFAGAVACGTPACGTAGGCRCRPPACGMLARCL